MKAKSEDGLLEEIPQGINNIRKIKKNLNNNLCFSRILKFSPSYY